MALTSVQCGSLLSVALVVLIAIKAKDFRVEYIGHILVVWLAGSALPTGISMWWRGAVSGAWAAPAVSVGDDPSPMIAMAGLVITLVSIGAIVEVFKRWIR